MIGALALAVAIAMAAIFFRESRFSITSVTLTCCALLLFLCQTRVYSEYQSTLAIGRWVGLGALVIAATARAIARQHRIRLRSGFVVFGAVCLWCLASASWSVDEWLTRQRAISAVLMLVAIGASVASTKDLDSELVLLIRSTVWPIVCTFWVLTAVYGFDTSLIDKGIWRTAGPMNNPNAMGIFGCLLGPLTFVSMRGTRGWQRVAWGGAVGTMGIMVLTSASRGALAGAIAAGALFLVTESIVLRTKITMAILGGLAAGGVSVYGMQSVSQNVDRYIRQDSIATGSGRTEAWQATRGMILRRPFFGWGFGTEDMLFERESFQFLQHQGLMVHNSYLGLAVQVGVPAALVVFGMLVGVTARGVRNAVRNRMPVDCALAATALAGLVICFTESWVYSAGNGLSFMYWLAFAFLLRRTAGEEISLLTGSSHEEGMGDQPAGPVIA